MHLQRPGQRRAGGLGHRNLRWRVGDNGDIPARQHRAAAGDLDPARAGQHAARLGQRATEFGEPLEPGQAGGGKCRRGAEIGDLDNQLRAFRQADIRARGGQLVQIDRAQPGIGGRDRPALGHRRPRRRDGGARRLGGRDKQGFQPLGPGLAGADQPGDHQHRREHAQRPAVEPGQPQVGCRGAQPGRGPFGPALMLDPDPLRDFVATARRQGVAQGGDRMHRVAGIEAPRRRRPARHPEPQRPPQQRGREQRDGGQRHDQVGGGVEQRETAQERRRQRKAAHRERRPQRPGQPLRQQRQAAQPQGPAGRLAQCPSLPREAEFRHVVSVVPAAWRAPQPARGSSNHAGMVSRASISAYVGRSRITANRPPLTRTSGISGLVLYSDDIAAP